MRCQDEVGFEFGTAHASRALASSPDRELQIRDDVLKEKTADPWSDEVLMQFAGRNQRHRRQLLEVVPRVPLPGAIFEESCALCSVRRGPVVDDGREFPEELIEHPGLLGECGALCVGRLMLRREGQSPWRSPGAGHAGSRKQNLFIYSRRDDTTTGQRGLGCTSAPR